MRQTRPYVPGATLRLPAFGLGSPADREPGRWGRELRLRAAAMPRGQGPDQGAGSVDPMPSV